MISDNGVSCSQLLLFSDVGDAMPHGPRALLGRRTQREIFVQVDCRDRVARCFSPDASGSLLLCCGLLGGAQEGAVMQGR